MIWFVLLVLWPLAELYVIVRIAEAIGFLWMLLLLLVSWPVGMRIIRMEGRAALRRLREALAMGRAPADEVLNGILVLVGGVLLMVPGFITDVVGLLLLLRPTRALAHRALARNHRSVWLRRAVNLGGRGFARPAGRGAAGEGHDAEAQAVDIDEPQLEP